MSAGGGDAATPGGGDAVTPDGGDAATPGGGDAVTPDGGDAVTPAGADPVTPDGGDAGTPDGGDAVTPDGGDAATPAGEDAVTPAGGDAATPGRGDVPPSEHPAPRGDAAPGADAPRIPAVVGPGGLAVHRLDGRPADRHADLRARMLGAGRSVGPDGPVAPLRAPVADAVRRAFDVAVAAVALAVLAVPLAFVLLLVRLESPGHPIFRQRRVGRDGHEFDVLKVRTMVQGAETMGAGLAIVQGDARITRLGRLLRRTSIDELPQFVNVLRGEMAIVGPRPTVPVQIERYDERQVERLLVRPGLTGWAQVQGRTTLSWPERIEFDRWYVAHRTLRTDLRILGMTVRVVLGGAGVERDGAAWSEAPPEG